MPALWNYKRMCLLRSKEANEESQESQSQVVKEMEDRNSRKNNFLIFHAQEINSDLKNEVDKNNCNIANNILVNCNIGEKLDSHHVTRIGLKGQNPRPFWLHWVVLKIRDCSLKDLMEKLKIVIMT